MRYTTKTMFEWAEAQRALASGLSNEVLATALLEEPMICIGAAESEFSVGRDEAASYDLARGILREAAFRLAKVRSYDEEPKA